MTTTIGRSGSAIISDCGLYRYRLEREVADAGPVYAYFGVNGSTAGPVENDHTVCKWIGFTQRFGGRKLIVGNPFAYRSTDVRALAKVDDPIGPENYRHLRQIMADADILVPCWGDTAKVPDRLRGDFAFLLSALLKTGKPVLTFGLTKNGSPMHPLMLSYATKLKPWGRPS